ncbi:MAG: DNA mismatch repair endonuclease MutL, partial [Chitinophagaceae bacterium]
MPDIIQLLPDHIANQIAAGEVIQRPASAVKELLENAVDAGATEVKLLVNDAGKSLIQVIDNGCGMSETDARMAFERHATSKISKMEDLFRIKTMGFRGEALASIAAVAQVEVKTKRAEDTNGVRIEIENSMVVTQEPAACTNGTSIAMKNLFFNIPARRNFLKSNAAEMRHVVDEFIRVALAFPDVFFSLTHNGQQMFHLEKGTIKQRILQVLGNHYNTKLVSVQEKSDYVNIYGFIGKPETARKTRGDQYFFVNNRFIKSPYLNHAVSSAFQEMIPADSFPAYVLFIDLDPAQVDINVHPTKQEIKFEDEKIIYAFIQSAVKHALAQFSIAPSLDFELDPHIQRLDAVQKPFTEVEQQAASHSSLFQTFTQRNVAHKIDPTEKNELKHWKSFFTPSSSEASSIEQHQIQQRAENAGEIGIWNNSTPAHSKLSLSQLLNTYILVADEDGFLLVHQQLAHERVLYNRYQEAVQGEKMATQRSLFPSTIQVSAQDAALLTELMPDLQMLGYEIDIFGKDSFVIQGSPADVTQGNEAAAIELLLEQFKFFSAELKFSKREKLIRSLAKQHAIRAGQALSHQE